MEGGEGIAGVLSIILFILKWLGILLLGILGLVLLLLLLLCLVPIRYELKGRFREDLKARADVTWLLHLIHLWVGAIGTQILCKIKALGHCFKKLHIGSWGEEEEAAAKQGEAADKPPEAKPKAPPEVNSEKEKDEKKDKDKKKDKEKKEKKDKYDRLFEALDREDRRKEEEKRKAAEKEKNKELTVQESNLGEDDQSLKEKVRHWKEEVQLFWEDDKNREAVVLIKEQLQKLGGHLLPTHFLLEGNIGLKDPAATGELVAKVYRFYPLYGDCIRLNGVYDRPMTDIYTEVKGRIRLGIFVEIGVRLLLNKRCRQWARKMLKKDKD